MASSYIPGYINSMDVLNFGFNTQSAMFWQSQHAALDAHNGIRCDGCGIEPLRGIRWKCQSCPDHDICDNCKKAENSPDHPFQMVSRTTTNNQTAAATGGQQVPEAGVHWTTCTNCDAYPIRGTMYACKVCPSFDLCEACNKQRIAAGNHQHYFEFFYSPRACNPPPQVAGGTVQRPIDPIPHAQQAQAIQQQPTFQQTASQQPTTIILRQSTPIADDNWTPPVAPNAPFIPRGGHGDAYFHESTYAPKNTEYFPRQIAIAKYQYLAQADDELSFLQGGHIAITGFPNKDWWSGEWKGLTGLFPSNHVELKEIQNHAACEGYWQ